MPGTQELLVLALEVKFGRAILPGSDPLEGLGQKTSPFGAQAPPGANGEGLEGPALGGTRQVILGVFGVLLLAEEGSPPLFAWGLAGLGSRQGPTVRNGDVHGRGTTELPRWEQEIRGPELGVRSRLQGNFLRHLFAVRGQECEKSVLHGVVAAREVVPGAAQEVVPPRVGVTGASRAWDRGRSQGQAQVPPEPEGVVVRGYYGTDCRNRPNGHPGVAQAIRQLPQAGLVPRGSGLEEVLQGPLCERLGPPVLGRVVSGGCKDLQSFLVPGRKRTECRA